MPKIAVLVLDTPVLTFKETYGDFGDQAIQVLQTSPLSKDFEFVKFQTIEKFEVPAIDDLKAGKYAALYLSGSRCDSFDDSIEWIRKLVLYIKTILQLQVQDPKFKIVLIGVCFGHQIIARAAGLDVGRNSKGWEIGVTKVSSSEKFTTDFNCPSFNVVEMHQDIVLSGKLPESWYLVGSTPIAKFQGLYSPGHVITFQGHPEFSTEFGDELVAKRRDSGVITDEKYREIVRRNKELPNEGPLLAGIIMKIVVGN